MVEQTPNHHIHIATLQPDLMFGPGMSNLDLIRRTVEHLAAESPLDLVVLPEIFDGNRDSTDGAQARQFLQTLAAECHTHVIGGSCLIVDDAGRHCNSCFVVHRSGREAGRYDKRILFSDEADLCKPGQRPGVFDLDSIRVGVLICADLWHPELARELRDRIDLLAVPAKSSVPCENQILYARSVWHAMALTRAMENGLVVVVADWPEARHESESVVNGVPTARTHFTSGSACIVDPSHRPDMGRIQRVLDQGKSGVIRADIDLARLATYRKYRQSVGLLPGNR